MIKIQFPLSSEKVVISECNPPSSIIIGEMLVDVDHWNVSIKIHEGCYLNLTKSSLQMLIDTIDKEMKSFIEHVHE